MSPRDRHARIRALRYALRCISANGTEPGKTADTAILVQMLHHEDRLLNRADLEPLPDLSAQ